MNEKCLVTITLGTEFEQKWRLHCFPSWKRYASQHGYDLINITNPLDTSGRAKNRSASWQRCLIFGLPELQVYQQIVWIDADIVINTDLAPCIASYVPEDAIGGVEQYSFPTPIIYRKQLERKYSQWDKQGVKYVHNLTAQSFYQNYGINTDLDKVFHAGVIVASPAHHRQLFEKVYYNYEDKGEGQWNYEMRPLSYEIVKSGYACWLPNQFNLLVGDFLYSNYQFLYKFSGPSFLGRIRAKLAHHIFNTAFKIEREAVNAAYRNSYFLHFAGMGFTKMHLLETRG